LPFILHILDDYFRGFDLLSYIKNLNFLAILGKNLGIFEKRKIFGIFRMVEGI
jgi:hypothetical protein